MKLVRRIGIEVFWLGIAVLAGALTWYWLRGLPDVQGDDLQLPLHETYLVIDNFTWLGAQLVALLVGWALYFVRTILQFYRYPVPVLLFLALSGGLWWLIDRIREVHHSLCVSTEGWRLYPPLSGLSDEPPAVYAGYARECDLVQQFSGLALLVLGLLAGLTLLVAVLRLVLGQSRL